MVTSGYLFIVLKMMLKSRKNDFDGISYISSHFTYMSKPVAGLCAIKID